eukprot:jgi/Botrbrau1/18123/Bobra.53_1s0002.1
MRAAVQIGVFDVVKGKKGEAAKFRNNATSEVLREDHPNCMKYMATHQVEDNWPAWGELAWGVQTGGLTFNKSHNGLAQFPYFQAHPEQEHRFSRAMASVNHLGTRSLWWKTTPGEPTSAIIDIGGAYGAFLASHPGPPHPPGRGFLFDQPQVIERAPKVWDEQPKWKSVPRAASILRAGNFFSARDLPVARRDAYVMRLFSTTGMMRTPSNPFHLRKAMRRPKTTLCLVETCVENDFNDPLMTRASWTCTCWWL